jgi:hypothetical protein
MNAERQWTEEEIREAKRQYKRDWYHNKGGKEKQKQYNEKWLMKRYGRKLIQTS